MNTSYLRISNRALDLKVADMMRDGLMYARARIAPDGVVVTHVWGTCPRCKDPIDVLQTFHPDGTGPSADTNLPYLVNVACDCDAPRHDGAPPGGGCGALFYVEAPFSDPSLF